MTLIVDAHTHIFPNPLRQWFPLTPESPFTQIRRHARTWVHPFVSPLHDAQSYLRVLPNTARRGIEEISTLLALPALVVESTAEDLHDAMNDAGVDRALVIAHPPTISNELVLEACRHDPKLIPVVNIPINAQKPGDLLKSYASQGAKGLKIHAAADGEGPDSTHYQELLRAADDLGIPVILHTGCIHSHLVYRNPAFGDVSQFKKWFSEYPNVRFVLAHMNQHEPTVALDLLQEHPNVYTDTSWQPTEVIGEAVRRVGSDRILFGTDWPLIGNNMRVGLKRVKEAVETGLIKETDADQIRGRNAIRLFGLQQQE